MGGARKVNNQTKCSNDSVFKMLEIHAFGNVLNHFELAIRTGEETMKTDDEESLNINFCSLYGLMEKLVLQKTPTLHNTKSKRKQCSFLY